MNCLAAVRWTLATAARLHRIRWSPFADIFHPLLSYTLLYIYEVSHELSRGSPMDSCHGSPSSSDPMESVCRHFPPPPQLYLAVYLLSLARSVSRQSNGLLPRQRGSIGSDGVRLPTFSTPSLAIPCCIFTKYPLLSYTLLYIYEVSHELSRGSPMDSCHGSAAPSDPMESVCQHFPPPPQLYFAVYLLSLSRTVFR